MRDLFWVKCTPRDIDDRQDLAVVISGLGMTILYSEQRGQLFKTQGGFWYIGSVQ